MAMNLALRTFEALLAVRCRSTDEDGQTLAEYGMVMATVAVAVIVLAIVTFRGSITSAFDAANDCLHKASTPLGC